LVVHDGGNPEWIVGTVRVEIKEKGSGDKYFITRFNRRGSGRRHASERRAKSRQGARQDVMIVKGG